MELVAPRLSLVQQLGQCLCDVKEMVSLLS